MRSGPATRSRQLLARARQAAGRLPEGLTDAARLWLLLRLGLGAVALVWLAVDRLPGPCHYELAWNGWSTFPPLDSKGWDFSLIGVWQRWDACWYTKIAAYGYETGTSATAFFPLLPALIRAVGALTAGDVALAGLVVNAVAFPVAMTGLFQLVRDDFGPAVARRTVLYTAVFPTAFFFFAPFTEALFLAGAVWAVLGARRRDWTVAGLAAGVAALSRTQGVLLVLPLAWEAWRAWREPRPAGERSRFDTAVSLVAVALPAVAAGAYAAWAAAAVGESPLAAQALWGGQTFHAPWETLAAATQWAIGHGDPIEALNVVGLILFTLLFLVGLRRLPAAYSLVVLPQLLVVAIRLQPTPLTATLRFLLVVFPCFVVLALLGARRRVHEVWLVISLLGLGTLVALFLRGTFVA